MTTFKKIKKLLGPKPTFGTNPNDPWSAKAEINESSLLNKYLESKGLNPETISTDMKISHSKSNAFKMWAQTHREEVQEDIGHIAMKQGARTRKNATTIQKTLSSYKEIKTPRGPGVHQKEGSQTVALTPEDTHPYSNDNIEKQKKKNYFIKQIDREKERESGIFKDINHDNRVAQKLAKKEEYKLDETKRMSAREKLNKALDKTRKDTEDDMKYQRRHAELERISKAMGQKSLVKNEDVGDAKAAVHADGLPDTAILDPEKKLSKSVNMVKKVVKRMREEIYDHEKEDKSVATYGKKPKFEKADPKDSTGEKKPQAAAVLSGGKTLTGKPRDTIEIDPIMRNRPNQPDVTKKDEKKKEDKDGKKETKKDK